MDITQKHKTIMTENQNLIKLHNTLTGTKEVFTPLKAGEVSMYNCGPTVYNYAHIGNLRSYIFADTLKRVLTWNGFRVKQVINITDVGHLVSDNDEGEDRMEKGARREGKTAYEVAAFYTEAFFQDLDKVGIDRNVINFPRATAYIEQQIDMIKTLEEKGYTYKIDDGIYFDTSKFPEYGKLGNINLKGLEEGARIGINIEKRNATDFALWKFSPKEEKSNEKREMEWESPWGVGFTGCHIECSAISNGLLGETFDIHTGGIDHIPVHHNNEIAQSECANHAPFVKVWMHNAFLNIKSETGEEVKMAKSGENFIRLQSILDRGIDPLAFRYLMLTARYSSPLDFTWESLEAAQTALKKLRINFQNLPIWDETISSECVEQLDSLKKYNVRFTSFINNDLDTPQTLALIWEIIKDPEVIDVDKKYLLSKFDSVLGLQLDKKEIFEIPENVERLIKARDAARSEKNYTQSDLLRSEIEAFGFEVNDTPEGTRVSPK